MSDQQKINIILQHHFDLYRTIARTCGGTHNTIPAYEWCSAPFGNDYPNFIFNEKKHLIDTEHLKEQLSKGNFPAFWLSRDVELDAIIKKVGFRKIQSWLAMAMAKDELIVSQAIPQLEYSKVNTADELRIWAQLMGESFRATYQLDYFLPLLDHPSFEFFLFHKQEMPVATTMNYYKDDIVGVHMVATHPLHRQQGIGQWAFSQSIQKAFDKGMHTAICTAMPKGANAWQKIGFKVYDNLYLYWRLSKIKNQQA